MPKAISKDAAPADDKSKAAGEQTPDNKGDVKDTNPSNGQSIAQVAGGENSKSGDSKEGKPKEGDERDSLIVDLKKENREMKKMIRDEVIPTIRDLQQQIKKGGTSADDALDELDALAKEWELEPKFVHKLANILAQRRSASTGPACHQFRFGGPFRGRTSTASAQTAFDQLDCGFE
jgi:hypothetical protein